MVELLVCDKDKYSKSMMSFIDIVDDFLLQKVTQKALQLRTFGIIPNGWYDVWATTTHIAYLVPESLIIAHSTSRF